MAIAQGTRPQHVHEVDKRTLCDTEGVTLNGSRAKICGCKKDFATVIATGGGESYEWAWPAVQHVVDNRGGAFRS